MKKKRILFLFVTLFASTLLYSQVVGVKTNLVMDAMKIINLGAEVGLSKKLTLDLYANYNPWKLVQPDSLPGAYRQAFYKRSIKMIDIPIKPSV